MVRRLDGLYRNSVTIIWDTWRNSPWRRPILSIIVLCSLLLTSSGFFGVPRISKYQEEPPSARAAASYVQSDACNVSNSSSCSPTLTSGATANNLLVAFCASRNSVTLTDLSGWTLIQRNESATPSAESWYTIASGGETSITCTASTGTYVTGILLEYSGIDTASPLDNSNTAGGSGDTTAECPSVTNASGTDLYVALLQFRANSNISSWSNSFNEREDLNTGSGANRNIVAAADKVATGTQSTVATSGSSGAWRCHAASFNEGAVSPTVSGGCFTDETEGTPCTDDGSNQIKVAVNGSVNSGVDTVVDGSWSFTLSSTPSTGAILVFFIDGEATESEEATTVVKYDGSGDINLVKMYQSQLVIGTDSGSANTDQTITVADLDTATNGYENSDDEDVLYDVTAGADLTVDAGGNKTEQLYVMHGETFRPASAGGSDVTTEKISIDSTAVWTADSNSIFITGTSGTLFTRVGTFTAGTSTVTYSGDGAATLTSGTFTGSNAFNNLTLSPTITAARTYTFGSGAIEINGDFTINPTAASALTLTVNMGAAITVAATKTTTISGTTSGASNLSTTGSNHSLTTGLLNVTNSGGGGTLTANGSTITITGTSGTLLTVAGTFTEGTSTVIFNGDGSPTALNGNTAEASTFNNLTLSPTITTGRTYAFGTSALTVNGDLTINPSAGSSLNLAVNLGANATVATSKTTSINGSGAGPATSTLDLRPSAVDYSLTTGLLNIGSNGTLDAGSSASIITLTGTSGTLFTRSGTFTQGSSEVKITSTSGSPTFLSGATTFHKLTIDSAATVINMGSAVTINDAFAADLTITSGTFNVDAADITGPGGLNGSLVIGASGALCLGGTTGATNSTCNSGATQTVVRNLPAFSIYSFNSTSTVRYLSDAAQTVDRDPTYGNLILSPTITAGRVYTFESGSVSVNGDLTIQPNAASALALTVNLAGNVTVASSKTTTITRSGSATSTLDLRPASTDYNLATGHLTIATGGTLDAGGSASLITVSGDYTNNGTFTAGTSKVLLNATTTGRTLNGTMTGSSAFYDLEIDNGLVGYWKFDNNAAPDESGDGNNLTLNGSPSFVSGVNAGYYGNDPGAISLDGTNSASTASPSASLKPTNNYTVAAWVKTSSTDTSGAEVVSMGNDYMLRINPSGGVEFIFYNGSTWTNCQSSGVNVLSGSWVSIVGFKDSTNGSEIYVNNIDRTSGCTSTADVVYAHGTSFNIGRHGNGSANYDFNGEIDDVRVYSRVWSTGEISDYHNGNHPAISDYTLSGDLDVSNNLSVRTGKLDVSADNRSISVGNNYVNVANFDGRAGTLTMTATDSGNFVQSDPAFNTLEVNGASGAWALNKQRLDTNGNLTITNGTLDVSASSCHNSAACAVTIGNNYSNSGIFTARTGTVTFDATDTGNTLSGTLNGSSAFYNLTFNGSGGEWSVNAAALISQDLTVTAGTVIGSNNITVNRHVTGAGAINLSGGTFEQRVDASATATANFGTTSGTANWAFSDLTFSNSVGLSGSLTIATQTGGSGTITVAGVLRVGKSGDADTTVLNAGNRTWMLSGTGGDPFQLLASPAADLNPSTSTFSYTGNNGAGDTTVQVETYNVLQINNGSETFNLEGNTTAATLTISAGTLALNGFTLNVNGVLTVNGTLSGSTNVTVTDNVTGSGTVTLTGGTFEQLVSANKNFGSSSGANEWRFATLILSSSALGDITISPNAGTGTIRVDTLFQIGRGTDGARTTFDNNTANDRVLDINGSISITSKGTLGASNNQSFTVGDDWTLTSGGVFTHNSGEVIFDTTNTARFTGPTTFYKLTSTTAAKTLEFTAGETFTIDTGGVLTLTGAANPNWIHVHSSSPGNQWLINHQGTESVSFVHVSDSGCDLSSTDITTSSSFNDGNNGTCWKFDPVFSQEDYRFGQPNGLDIDYTGAPAENNPYTTTGTGDDFRLRMLIHVADTELSVSGKDFKLQFGEKTGATCTSGVSWGDVATASGVIRYFDGAGRNDGDNLIGNAGDPDHGHTVVNQDYEEANNFTNSVAAIPAGQDGLWDFSLVNNSAVGGKRYCFRAVEADGTLFANGYNQYPEVIIDEELVFTLDATSKDFGVIQPGDNPTDVSSTLTATTNSSTGYVVYAWATQQMTMGSFTIDDWSGTNASPTAWPNGSFGFGYTTDDSSLTGGTADRFTNGGAKYAGFVHTGPGDPVADRTTGPVSNQQNIITYRIAASGGQQAGTYNTVIVYVISVTF